MDEVIGTGIVRRFVALRLLEIIRGRRVALIPGLRFQQRVLRKLLGNESLELEIAELQQLDRLAQLGREHQLLGLANA